MCFYSFINWEKNKFNFWFNAFEEALYLSGFKWISLNLCYLEKIIKLSLCKVHDWRIFGQDEALEIKGLLFYWTDKIQGHEIVSKDPDNYHWSTGHLRSENCSLLGKSDGLDSFQLSHQHLHLTKPSDSIECALKTQGYISKIAIKRIFSHGSDQIAVQEEIRMQI